VTGKKIKGKEEKWARSKASPLKKKKVVPFSPRKKKKGARPPTGDNKKKEKQPPTTKGFFVFLDCGRKKGDAV